MLEEVKEEIIKLLKDKNYLVTEENNRIYVDKENEKRGVCIDFDITI